MRVAFYAPLKPPDHPVPSGDRRMALLLIEALEQAGHRVEVANRLRSRDAKGDPERQSRLERIGMSRAERLLRRYMAKPADKRPEIWFTYHLYYKAPDWIGPRVADGLGIPYLVAEASVAHKRAGGPWDEGHRATLAALEQAALVIALNPLDVECLPDRSRARLLRPFLDAKQLQDAGRERARHRNRLAARFALDPEHPWLCTVAMMRHGDKLASYRLLAEALGRLVDLPWHLVIVGGGPARMEVEQAFAALGIAAPDRIHFAGEAEPPDVAACTTASDLFLWPAIAEAYGMAMLEAQAVGLPVVAGHSGGVDAIVRDGETGLLVPAGDITAFAEATRRLMKDAGLRHRMARAAAQGVIEHHSLDSAARFLDEILAEARKIGPRPAPDWRPDPDAEGEKLSNSSAAAET